MSTTISRGVERERCDTANMIPATAETSRHAYVSDSKITKHLLLADLHVDGRACPGRPARREPSGLYTEGSEFPCYV